MARTAIVGLVLLCLVSSALPVEAQRQSVWTVYTTVDATIHDSYAIVRVIADIGNRGPDPEFPFEVNVPDDAFVTGLTIERDGEVHAARIEEREAARQEYEEHKAEELTGGLVERRGATTYAFLVNVAEFESVQAILTYEVALKADQGVYTLDVEAPVSGFGQDLGAAFHAAIASDVGVDSAWGSDGSAERAGDGWELRHDVGPRPNEEPTPWSAHYTLEQTPGGGDLQATVVDGQGYFAHRFRAPPDEEQLPVDLILVLDVSGSMGGQKMDQLRDAATQVIQQLDDADRLHVAFFSGTVQQLWPGMESANSVRRGQAADAVADVRAAGATNIEAGLEAGVGAMEPTAVQQVMEVAGSGGNVPLLVFLTDGQASMGSSDPGTLRGIAADAREAGARVFALAFGSDADWSLVAGLARDGGGMALRVPEGAGAEVDLRRFMAAVTTPALRDVAIDYSGDVEAFQTSADVLFVGSELLVVGRFPASMERLAAEVSATAADGERSYQLSEPVQSRGGADHLVRLFAYSRISELEDLIAADGQHAAWVDEITDLAVEHGFVTDYTSLVLTLAKRPAPEQWQEAWAEDDASEGTRPASAPAAMADGASADHSDSVGGSGASRDSNEDATGDEEAATPNPLWLLLVALGVALAVRRSR